MDKNDVEVTEYGGKIWINQGIKKSIFVKGQEAKGLLSNLRIKRPLSKI